MLPNPSPECYLKSLANLSTWMNGAVKLHFTASLEMYSINSSAVKITGHRQPCFTWRLAMNMQLQTLTPGVRCNHSLKRCVSATVIETCPANLTPMTASPIQPLARQNKQRGSCTYRHAIFQSGPISESGCSKTLTLIRNDMFTVNRGKCIAAIDNYFTQRTTVSISSIQTCMCHYTISPDQTFTLIMVRVKGQWQFMESMM